MGDDFGEDFDVACDRDVISLKGKADLDENQGSEGGDSDEDGHAAEGDYLEESDDEESRAEKQKAEKKKRKIQELKERRKKMRESKDEDTIQPVMKTRMSCGDMYELLLQKVPISVEGGLELDLAPSYFFEPFSSELDSKLKCPFVRSISAGLPNYRALLQEKVKDVNGCPSIIIICSGAKRATDIIKSMAKFLSCKIAKLFAKHFKVQEQVECLNKQHYPIAVGTPNRLNKLIELGALSLKRTQIVLVDMALDVKESSILSMSGVSEDFYSLLIKSIQPEKDHLRIALVD